jgi:hypothetical protein
MGAIKYAIKLHLKGELVVMDRCFMSELVYGEAYRGGPYYDVGARVLDRALRRHGAVFILCAPADQERQAARWAAGRETGKHEHFTKVREVIAMYADLSKGNVAHPGTGYLAQLIRFGDFAQRDDVIVYDLDKQGHDLALVTKIILGRGRLLAKRALPFYGDNLTGRADLDKPRFLLVGEVTSLVASRWPGAPRWPFADRDTRLSSANWLNRAIHHLALAEDQLELTNAFPSTNGGLYLHELLAASFRYPKNHVIALGNSAKKAVSSLGCRGFSVIPHPQWHRRFKHAEGPRGYAELIRRAIG